jgi:alpha-L-fucosidase 2
VARFFPLLLCAAFLQGVELRDHEFARPGGVPLTLDAHLPDRGRNHPAVILVHGGGWQNGDQRTYISPWFPLLDRAGVAWLTINYRLAPKHPYPAAVEDVEAAVRYVRAHAARFRLDPKRLALMGESAGGHLVSLVGVRRKVEVRTVISFYGVHDIPLLEQQLGGRLRPNLTAFLGGADPREVSPVTHVSRRTPPMLLIHGTKDVTVPLAQSEAMCAALQQAGGRCELFLVDGGPHGVEPWEKNPALHTYKPKTVEWLRRELGIRKRAFGE